MADIKHFNYRTPAHRGWTPLLHERFGYGSPGDWYEGTLFHLIGREIVWLDGMRAPGVSFRPERRA